MRERHDKATADETTLPHGNVAFVPLYGQSSGNHRGRITATRLGAVLFYCHTAGGMAGQHFDVVIHVKHVCVKVLEMGIGRHHVLDHVDMTWTSNHVAKHPIGLRNFYEAYAHRFSGQIMNSGPQVDDQCRTSVCAVIPHHFNMECAPRLNRSANRVVGLIGWENLLEEELRGRGFSQLAGLEIEAEPIPGARVRSTLWTRGKKRSEELLRDESRQLQCAFFDRLRVAVAWNKQLPASRMYEPGQRYTNPIVLAIPTIAYAHQASYNEYNEFGGGHFLCANLSCLQSTVAAIRGGALDATFDRMRPAVVASVSWNATRDHYVRLFADLARCGSNASMGRCANLVRRNIDGTLRPHAPTWAERHGQG